MNTVPLYILKECVDVTTVAMDTARRLATLTTRGILCKVTYQVRKYILSSVAEQGTVKAVFNDSKLH